MSGHEQHVSTAGDEVVLREVCGATDARSSATMPAEVN